MVEVIGGLIGVMKLWLDYDVKKREAEKDSKPAPEKPEEADEGKQVAETIANVVEQHGDTKDQRALENFQEEPEDDLYAQKFQQILAALAEKHPAVAQQLQQMAKEAHVEPSGGKNNVNINARDKNVIIVGDKNRVR